MSSADNKFLRVKPGVILTPVLEAGAVELEKDFAAAGVVAWITSGKRGPEDQLRIIRGALVKLKLDAIYPEAFKCGLQDKIQYQGKTVFAWQPGWSALLNAGFVVNPPLAAECLMDYYRPGSTVNKKGKVIGMTPHWKGTALDIGGGPDGISGITTNELSVMNKAMARKAKGLKGFLPEHGNNAIHCDFFPAWRYVIFLLPLFVAASCSKKTVTTITDVTDSTIVKETVRMDTIHIKGDTVVLKEFIECDSNTNKPKPFKVRGRSGRASSTIEVKEDGSLHVESVCDSLQKLIASKDKEIFRLRKEKKTVTIVKEPSKFRQWIDYTCRILAALFVLYILFNVFKPRLGLR